MSILFSIHSVKQHHHVTALLQNIFFVTKQLFFLFFSFSLSIKSIEDFDAGWRLNFCLGADKMFVFYEHSAHNLELQRSPVEHVPRREGAIIHVLLDFTW